MGNLYLDRECWKFESDNEIEYSIYEGVGHGDKTNFLTDIAFIVLDEYCEENIPTQYVGMRYGYTIMDDDFNDSIAELVAEFERTHPSIVKTLGKAKSFADNKDLLQSFFSLSKTEFLGKYDDIRERDYDETARVVAEKIANIRTWN